MFVGACSDYTKRNPLRWRPDDEQAFDLQDYHNDVSPVVCDVGYRVAGGGRRGLDSSRGGGQ